MWGAWNSQGSSSPVFLALGVCVHTTCSAFVLGVGFWRANEVLELVWQAFTDCSPTLFPILQTNKLWGESRSFPSPLQPHWSLLVSSLPAALLNPPAAALSQCDFWEKWVITQPSGKAAKKAPSPEQGTSWCWKASLAEMEGLWDSKQCRQGQRSPASVVSHRLVLKCHTALAQCGPSVSVTRYFSLI